MVCDMQAVVLYLVRIHSTLRSLALIPAREPLLAGSAGVLNTIRSQFVSIELWVAMPSNIVHYRGVTDDMSPLWMTKQSLLNA